MSNVMKVSGENFEQVVQAEGLVVVDFSAAWCGPCRRLEPELEAAAAEVSESARVVKVDVDADPELAMRYGVQGIPNLTFLKGGKVVDKIVGLVPRATIVERIKANA
jgi:thioredoxin 1